MTDYFKYNDPVKIQWRKGTINDPYVQMTDALEIVNSTIALHEVPDEHTHVKVQGYFEVKDKVPNDNEFVVDYRNGIVTFNSSQEGKTVTAVYLGKGFILYPAKRIYLENEDKDIIFTLQDMINESEEVINQFRDIDKVVIDGKETVAKIESGIATGNYLVTEMTERINTGVQTKNELVSRTETAVQERDNLDKANILATVTKNNLTEIDAKGQVTKTELDASIATGSQLNDGLASNIAIGTPLKEGLDTSISEANLSKTALVTSTLTANQAKIDVDGSTALANTAKQSLDQSVVASEIAKTNLDASTVAGNSTDEKLKASTVIGETLKVDLDTRITKGEELKGNLDTSIATATTSKTALDTSISDSVVKKTDLDKSITDSATSKTALDASVVTAVNTKADVDTSTTTANQAKTSLDETVDTSLLAKTALKDVILVGDELNDELSHTITVGNVIANTLTGSVLAGENKIQEMDSKIVEANTATTLATEKAGYAKEQGDYAKAQGEFATEQTDILVEKGSSIVNRGIWSNVEKYKALNIVVYNSGVFQCLQENTGIEPSETVNPYWQLLLKQTTSVTWDTVAGRPDVEGHIANQENPHSVTASQINAYEKTEVDTLLLEKVGFDINKKIPLQYIPDTAKQQTYVLSNTEERLSLVGLIVGDKAFEIETGDSYIFDGVQWRLMADADWENVSLDWSNLLNKPSTLDGYGITDALSKLGGEIKGDLIIDKGVPKLIFRVEGQPETTNIVWDASSTTDNGLQFTVNGVHVATMDKNKKTTFKGDINVNGSTVYHEANLLEVTTDKKGLMSGADKAKLDGLRNSPVVGDSEVNGNVLIDGVETQVYTHPSGDGNQHVPETGVTNEGKVLKAGAIEGALAWSEITASEIVTDADHKFVTEQELIDLKNKQEKLTFTPEDVAKKGVPDGYASLDAEGLIPLEQLPKDIASSSGGEPAKVFNKTYTMPVEATMPLGSVYRYNNSMKAVVTGITIFIPDSDIIEDGNAMKLDALRDVLDAGDSFSLSWFDNTPLGRRVVRTEVVADSTGLISFPEMPYEMGMSYCSVYVDGFRFFEGTGLFGYQEVSTTSIQLNDDFTGSKVKIEVLTN